MSSRRTSSSSPRPATEPRRSALLRNFSGLGRREALVLLSFLQHAHSWDCAGVAVTSLQVHEDMIESFLRSRAA